MGWVLEVFQTSYISILLMEQKYRKQVGGSRSRSRSRLQNEYKIQNAQSYNQFVKELGTEITGKGSINLLHSSTATQNGELQTLQSIKQHRKSGVNAGVESKAIERSLQLAVNQNKENTNLASFPNSLLSIRENLASSELSNLVISSLETNFLRKENSNEKIGLTDFECGRNSDNIASKNCFCFSGLKIQQPMLSTYQDIKTLKILPKISLNQPLISYAQIGCQTESFSANVMQHSPRKSNKKASKNKPAISTEQQQNLLLNASEELDISLDEKCKQKAKTPSPIIKLKKNQEINQELSFQSQKQDKPCIWQKDFFQLEHQDLNQLHQRYTESETGSEQLQDQFQQNFSKKEAKLMKQLEQLRSQKHTLQQQLLKATQELKELQTNQNQLINKNSELQAINITTNERITQLLEEYKQLICLVQQYKQQIFDFQSQRKSSHQNFSNLQNQLNQCQATISKKEQEISQLQKQLHGVKEECNQVYLINAQLEEVLKAKSEQLEDKMREMQKERASYTQLVNFYKERLNNEGVIMNIEQLKQIQEFIESQREEQSQKMQHVERQFKKQLSEMNQQKKALLQVINKLEVQKANFKSSNKFGQSSQIQGQIEEILRQYDRQVEQRDEEICSLKKEVKKQMQYYNQFCYDNCAGYIVQVKKLREFMSFNKVSSQQLQIQFGYIVDKLIKINSILNEKNKNLQQQKTKIILLMKKVQDFYLQEIDCIKKQLQYTQIQKISFARQLKKLKENTQATKEWPKIHQNKHLTTPIAQKKKTDPLSLYPLKKSRLQYNKKQQQDGQLLKFKKINLQRKYSYLEKLKVSLTLLEALSNRLKANKKIQSILVTELYLREKGTEFEIEFCQKLQKEQDSTNQKQMLYHAPQVLLGFTQSQQSYVWTLGLLMDELFEGSPFYKKLNEIKSRIDNYYCRNPSLKVKGLLQSMLKKNHKVRITLQQIKNQITNEINSFM